MKNLIITGKEELTSTGSLNALIQFYKAFNTRDLNLMEANWENGDEIVMDNPLGGIMRGWSNVKPVYERIFTGQANVYVEFYDFSIHSSEELFYAVGRERGELKVNNKKLELSIRTSRIFRKFSNDWRQVHHHGSIEDPGLLQEYQNLVRKQ